MTAKLIPIPAPLAAAAEPRVTEPRITVLLAGHGHPFRLDGGGPGDEL